MEHQEWVKKNKKNKTSLQQDLPCLVSMVLKYPGQLTADSCYNTKNVFNDCTAWTNNNLASNKVIQATGFNIEVISFGWISI